MPSLSNFASFAGAFIITMGAVTNICAQSSPNAPLVYYAASTGHQTLDQGEGGGNPFASALIELIDRTDLSLDVFTQQLKEMTAKKSHGRQLPDVPVHPEPAGWRFSPKIHGERRQALVLVYSDYSASGGAKSLPGAKHDAERITAALKRAGFETESVIDPKRSNLKPVLASFATRSSDADVALVYTTGHGVEVDGTVYLLPGDYPVARPSEALADDAIAIPTISANVRARHANFVFYGGCRDNPFQRR